MNKKSQLLPALGLLLLSLLFSIRGNAQLFGTYNVPGTYTSVASVINDLNIYGITGPVVINVAAGYTETAVSGGYTLNAIVGTSSVNTVTFQKSGSGANPIIYAYTGGTGTSGSAAQDGVWRFNGTDYLTIDGIDINDPNTTNPGTMEFGYGFFKASATDGCQFNTIKNCTITLNNVNNAAGSGPAADGSRGIDVVNALVNAHTTAVTVLTPSGSNSNNKFYSNLIQKCNYGIALLGYAAPSPFTLADQNNDIGGNSISTGNNIINFGGGGTTAPASAVRTLAQYNINVSYNLVNNNNGAITNHATTLRGIYLNTATSANATISNNTVTLKGGGTTTQMSPIENVSGATAANNTVNISNNLITNCTYSTATTGVYYGIYNNGASAANLMISGNTFSNNSTNATSGTYYNIYNTGAATTSITISSNTISGITYSATSTSLTNYNIMNSGGAGTATLVIKDNVITGISYVGATGGTGAWAGVYCSASTSVSTIQANLLVNLNIKTTGTMYLIYHSQNSKIVSANSNSIITAFNRTAAGTGATYFYYNLSGSTTNPYYEVYNNNFSNFNNGTNTGALYMLYNYYGAVVTNIYGNVCSNVTAASGTSGMYMFYGPYYGATNNIYNNTWTNITYGTGTVYGMYFYNYYGTNSNIYSNTWHNITSSGTNYGIYYYYPGGATSGGVFNFFRNKISDMTTNSASASLYGMYVLGYYAGQTVNIHNNVIGNLFAPSSTNGQAVTGMYFLPQAAYNLNVSFNSVYLSGTSVGSGFGSNGIYSSTSYNTAFKNNVVVNNCTATGTGSVVAHRRNGSSITTYAGSDNNLFYAGTPSSTNLIYSDGVNNLQTLAAYKSFIAPNEAASVTENPPFAVLTGSASNFLSVSGTSTTQIESGATPISGITADYANTTRSSTAPDIGAWEGNYINVNPPCSGAPSSGTVTVSPSSGCANQPYVVSVSGQTGMNISGIVYTWQSSSSASGPWTNMTGITGPSFSQSVGVSSNVYYRFIVTCTNSAQSSTSSVIGYSVNTCVATATLTDAYGDGWNGALMSLVVGTSTTTFGGGFTTGTSQVLSFCLPSSSTYSLYLTAPGSYATEVGIILDAGGSTYTITGATSGGPLSSATSGSLLTSGNTCTNTVASCTNVVSGSVTISSSSGCSNQGITLTGSGITTGSGIVYQWQSATSTSGPWTSVPGATTAVFTTSASALTYYRLVTTCTISSQSATTAAQGYTVNSCVATVTLTDSYGDGWNGGQMQLVVGGQTITLGSGFTTGTSQILNFCLPTATTYSLIFSVAGSYPTEMGVVLNLGGSTVANVIGANSGGPLTSAPTGSVISTGLSCQCSSANGGTVSTASYSICSSAAVNMSSSGFSGGNGNTYQWQVSTVSGGPYTNVSGGTGASTPSYSTPALSSGTYYYVLQSTCSSSTAASNEVTVNVNAPATPSFVATPPVICNPGGSTTLTASGAASYTWSNGATTPSIVLTPTASSIINVIGSSNNACANVVSANYNLYYSFDPTLTISSSPSIACAGTQFTLTGAGSANSYSWSSGATGTLATVSPSVSGVYTLTGTKIAGCFASITQSLTVNPNPIINISGSSGICTGQTASLTASGANTYTWNTGAIANSITPSPTSNTTYTVTGTSNLGCNTTTTQLVTVAASLSITITGPSSICVGQTATLTGNGGVTYTWNTGATSTTIAPSPSVTTTYSIIGASGTCSNTGLMTLTVNTNPTVSISGNAIICAGQSTTLTASGASTYSWSTSGSGVSVVVSPSVNASYTVTGTSAAGCNATAIQAVVSNSLPVITIAQSTSSICVNSPATFTASGANTYTWSTNSNNVSISITPTASAVYTVNGSSTAGCVSSNTFALGTYPLPTVVVVPSSATVCSMSQVTLSGSGAVTYTWNGTQASQTASFNPVSSTVYSLSGTSAQGCISNATVAVTTNSLPVLTISPSSIAVCALSPATFTANGANTYTWNNTAVGSTITLYQATSTTHSVSGTTSQGCTNMTTVAVVALPLPTISVTPSLTTVCAFSSLSLSASGAVSYTWSNNSTGTVTSVTPSQATSYSVIGVDANNCMSVGNAIVITNSLPAISLVPASATVCALTPVTFTASGANTYTWTGGVNGSTATMAPPSNTVYTVSGEDATTGCVGTTTFAVNTNSIPVLSISASSASVCTGSSASLTVSGANTYTWLVLGNTGSTLVVTPTASAVYTVDGTDNLGCVGTKTINLGVFNLPNITVSSLRDTICVGEVASFTANGASTYTWMPGNVNAPTFTASPNLLAQYTVTGTDANGCESYTNHVLYVRTCTGIADLTKHSELINVFPNPSTGVITARFDFDGVKEILIIDELGKAIEMRVTDQSSEEFNLTKYAKGMYLVRVKTPYTTGFFKVSIQ